MTKTNEELEKENAELRLKVGSLAKRLLEDGGAALYVSGSASPFMITSATFNIDTTKLDHTMAWSITETGEVFCFDVPSKKIAK